MTFRISLLLTQWVVPDATQLVPGRTRSTEAESVLCTPPWQRSTVRVGPARRVARDRVPAPARDEIGARCLVCGGRSRQRARLGLRVPLPARLTHTTPSARPAPRALPNAPPRPDAGAAFRRLSDYAEAPGHNAAALSMSAYAPSGPGSYGDGRVSFNQLPGPATFVSLPRAVLRTHRPYRPPGCPSIDGACFAGRRGPRSCRPTCRRPK